MQLELQAGSQWLAAGVPEGQDAAQLHHPLLPLPLPQWAHLQDHGGGAGVQQAAGEAEDRGRAEEDGGGGSQEGRHTDFRSSH